MKALMELIKIGSHENQLGCRICDSVPTPYSTIFTAAQNSATTQEDGFPIKKEKRAYWTKILGMSVSVEENWTQIVCVWRFTFRHKT